MRAKLLGLALGAAAATAAAAGEVQGTIRLVGSPPALPPLRVNKDVPLCGATLPDAAVEVSDGRLRNVVITVDARRPANPLPAALSLDQRGCRYHPRVQVAPVGSTLQIRNGDPVLHNIHGRVGELTVFNVAMPLQGMQVPRVLAKEGLVHVQCDVHSFMEGWVVVTDRPAAVSEDDGTFVVKDVPPGVRTVTAWHERYGKRELRVKVPASGVAKADFTFGGP